MSKTDVNAVLATLTLEEKVGRAPTEGQQTVGI